jgi:hypothetical protein
MTTLRKLKRISTLANVLLIGVALQFTSCSAPSTTSVKTMPGPSSYIIPSTISTYDAGLDHNAMLYYIFTHYDTVKYASYSNKLSQTGFDSLAALFIADSLQPSIGYYTPTEVALFEADFDSTFNACLTSLPTYGQFVAGVDSAKSQGILASDEANFLINADTDIRLCTSYAQLNDTISSLISQWSSISWNPSTTHGVAAYGYLSIAQHSSAFWGQPGDTIAPIAAKPIVNPDADFYFIALAKWQNLFNLGLYPGLTEADVPVHAIADASAASAAATLGNGSDVPGKGVVEGLLIGVVIVDVGILVDLLIFF